MDVFAYIQIFNEDILENLNRYVERRNIFEGYMRQVDKNRPFEGRNCFEKSEQLAMIVQYQRGLLYKEILQLESRYLQCQDEYPQLIFGSANEVLYENTESISFNKIKYSYIDIDLRVSKDPPHKHYPYEIVYCYMSGLFIGIMICNTGHNLPNDLLVYSEARELLRQNLVWNIMPISVLEHFKKFM